MDISEIRRENLRFIAIQNGGPRGWVAWLANALGRSESQISQILGKNPSRNIGNRLARDVEEMLKLENGALDNVRVGEKPPVYGGDNFEAAPLMRRVPLIS